jgi:hypothetical protein
MMQTLQYETKYTWQTILRVLFNVPGVVLIGGPGKSGKTDFALKISEDLLKTPASNRNQTNNFSSMLIQEKNNIATNIDTFGHYAQISDLISIKQWLYANDNRKLYIFDEATEYLTNKRTMSSQNVGFMRLLPQVTKAHARMIVIGHNLLRVDKDLLDEAWCKGVFVKTDLKNAQLISNLFPKPFDFEKIPPTTVKFDPYAIAPFTERPVGQVYFKDEDLDVLWRWANGSNYKDLGLKPMQLHRKLQKYVLQTLQNKLNV